MADLLPPSAAKQEKSLAEAIARLSDIAVPIDTLMDPARIPAPLLPWLAWAVSVDNWDSAWPEEIKRRVIAASVQIHRQKGTIGALRRALEALDLDGVNISEWFEYDGDPHTFRVDLELRQRGLVQGEDSEILGAIETAKNLRSHLDKMEIWLTSDGHAPKFAAATACGCSTVVLPLLAEEIATDLSAPVYAMASHADHVTEIYPRASS